jgi:hypothetical protein
MDFALEQVGCGGERGVKRVKNGGFPVITGNPKSLATDFTDLHGLEKKIGENP